MALIKDTKSSLALQFKRNFLVLYSWITWQPQHYWVVSPSDTYAQLQYHTGLIYHSPFSVFSQSPSVPLILIVQLSSVAQSCPTLRHHELQHARPPCPSPTPRVHSNSRPSSQWCHPAISSSVVPFSSCLQSLPASEPFPMIQLFTWGGQHIGASALASFLPKKSQGWSPSEWTGWISLQSKGLSRVFSKTTVQKHQFFSAQLSSQSNSHIHTWPLEKP